MANYFDTDGMWDYNEHFATPPSTKATSLTLRKDGKIILDKVPSHKIRKYYKDHHITDGSSPRRVWRNKLTELGYTITNNYEKAD